MAIVTVKRASNPRHEYRTEKVAGSSHPELLLWERMIILTLRESGVAREENGNTMTDHRGNILQYVPRYFVNGIPKRETVDARRWFEGGYASGYQPLVTYERCYAWLEQAFDAGWVSLASGKIPSLAEHRATMLLAIDAAWKAARKDARFLPKQPELTPVPQLRWLRDLLVADLDAMLPAAMIAPQPIQLTQLLLF